MNSQILKRGSGARGVLVINEAALQFQRCPKFRRADMEALMARLVQTGRVLLDTRQQIAAVPKSTPLVDTRTIGKALTFTGEHKDWPEWSFQFVAYMGSVNPKID